MSLLHPSRQSREAFHDHLFYGAITFSLLIFGPSVGATIGHLIRAGVLG
ncbi:hypothetical protein [Microbacterium sp. NPDC078849]